MEDIKNTYKDLPQLIVALDSLGEDANYIHVKDAKENAIYYCPCCKRVIKPRAYKDDKEYQVQSHYYHDKGGCNDETFVHFICKSWLFESGCKFEINSIIYTVEKIKTEKTYHTTFGDYRPDITVYTKENKTFFFEIKNTNKKTEHYIPKWDELGNDVVEVDVRYFINQKMNSTVPAFNLIYSDGECFIKKYTRNEYEETIARRKLEWKRQDKLNYKMMWERLDWFWIELQHFKLYNEDFEKLVESFKILCNFDKEVCFDIIKKLTCMKQYNYVFREIINSSIKEEFTTDLIQSMFDDKLKIKSILFKDKKGVYINSLYNSTNLTTDINVNYFSKEWIFRYTEIVKLIDKIKNKKRYYDNRDTIKSMIQKMVNEIYGELTIITKQTIWEIEKPDFHFHDSFSLSVCIKNRYSYFHKESFSIYYEDIAIITKDELYNMLIKKLKNSMNCIHYFVNKRDGCDCQYRHVFISEKEVI